MMLQALIFDVDGTLADTEKDGHRVAFNQAFADFDLDWRWDVELYGELLAVTGGKERIRHYVSQHCPDYLQRPDFVDLVVQLHAAKTRHYTALLAEGCIPLRPGVLRLLRQARAQGLRLAIATTTTPANVTALLAHATEQDINDWFEVVGAGDVVPEKKPAPDIFYYVLQQLDLPATACIVFEDSENGIRATRAAGLGTIVTVNDYTRDHDFTDALLVLDQLGEPAQGFEVLGGSVAATSVDGAKYLDVALVRRLHGAS